MLLRLPPSVEEDHFRYGHMATLLIQEENDVQNTDKNCPLFYTLKGFCRDINSDLLLVWPIIRLICVC